MKASNQNCNDGEYYHLLANGEIIQVKELPAVSSDYSKSLLGNTAYKTFSNGTIVINIGHSGAWKPVLYYKDHKLLPVDENLIK